MTDREKLIELLSEKCMETCMERKCNVCEKDYCERHKEECTGYYADHLIASGVTFATDKNVGGKWIPVTEKLPETGGYYLVHQMNPKFRTSFIQHARYSETKERWLGAQAMCSLDYVTHWMPLPEPPEGE